MIAQTIKIRTTASNANLSSPSVSFENFAALSFAFAGHLD
jgi:uncharacterized protein with PQ loop repeat